MTPPGLLFVVSAPSGAGKHTILSNVRRNDPSIEYSVSVTTRKPRENEAEGIDYFFVERAEFERMIAAGELIEWAEVHGNLYGTPRRQLTELLATGKDFILELDVQGKRNIDASGMDAISIFIMPPDMQELERRLRARGTEISEAITVRLQNAEEEVSAQSEYDYVIINYDVEQAVREFETIVQEERKRFRGGSR